MDRLTPSMEELRDVDQLVLVCEHLLEDARYLLPQLDDKIKKDLAYIRRSANQRGLPFFVVDLPLLGKHFDKALDEGHYPPSTLAHSYALRHGSRVIPVFLGSFYSLVFAESGCLRDDYSVEAIRIIRQILYLAKKFSQPFSNSALDLAVLSLFEDDKLLPKPERFWFDSNPHWRVASYSYRGFKRSGWYGAKLGKSDHSDQLSQFLANLDLVAKVICDALGPFDPSQYRFKHGPGAISQVTGPSNKYLWYGWSDSLESVYPIADYGFHSYSSWADGVHHVGDEEYTPYSRLVAVPKTYEKPRLIAAEPSEHQFCQQNIWNYFDARTTNSWLGSFIRFRDQSLNQELCQKGSTDGSLSTIDLSSASDRVSCHAVGQFFSSNFGLLNALRATRTRTLRQRISKSSPEWLELNKFSTMGSACTFPVETLIFLGISISAVLTDRQIEVSEENIRSLVGEVAVFGDDIIIPSTSRKLLENALNLLDFKVNISKSYSEGNFRESCGVDCYKGEYVTPLYMRMFSTGSPESVSSLVSTANNFYSLFYLRTALYLESTAPSGLATVPPTSGLFGFHSRCGTRFRRQRWNRNLHREEVQALTFTARQDVNRVWDDSALHQYFTERPSPLDEWTSGVRLKPVTTLRYKWLSCDGA